jgi:hypothetical protein
MSQRLIGLILGAGTGLLLGGQLVIAADRIDLFDTNSNRTGYVIVDPKTKRFDTYDTKSHRTGWGTITQESGTVQVYDKNGNWIGTGKLPGPGVKRLSPRSFSTFSLSSASVLGISGRHGERGGDSR